MHKQPVGYCLFCDDIRDEIGGKSSYMGVYADTMTVEAQGPAILPKLAIMSLILVPKSMTIRQMSCRVWSVAKDQENTLASFEVDLTETPPPPVSLNEMRYNINFSIVPFHVKESCKLRVQAILDDEPLDLGTLLIDLKIASALT